MREIPAYFDVALREIGQAEINGPDHNQRIIEYHEQTSLKASDDETPWCASFVNWCLAVAGEKGTNSAAARSFVCWGYAASIGEIRAGDIAILARGKPWQGHVGFVHAWNADHIQLLGGNQNDSVSLQWYPVSRLVGLRRPS